jgi:hypothetical protein
MNTSPQVGKKLGAGCFRQVFEYGPHLVIKKEVRSPLAKLVCSSDSRRGRQQGSSNRREWLVWNAIAGTALAPYFAEAKALLPDGSLVMERAARDCRGTRRGQDARMLALAEALGMYDGCDENLGLFGRKLKFLDYQMLDLRKLETGVKLAQQWQGTR